MMSGQELDSLSNAYMRDFQEAFRGENYTIGNVTVNQKSEAVFFEVDVVPQEEGVYFIKQQFDYEDGWGYKHNSILNVIKVGPEGTARTLYGKEPNPFLSYTCAVGDTIVIPIYWNAHVVANEFSSGDQQERDIWGKIDPDKETYKNPERQPDWNINNEVEELKVTDVFSSYSVHRGLKNESATHTLQFEAISPGEFLLQVGDSRLPVTIVPRENQITKYVTQVIGRQWDDRATSTGLPQGYTKEPERATMRVGDTINVAFMAYVQKVDNPQKPDLALTITKRE